MTHNEIAEMIRTEICRSWETEIYEFARGYAGPYSKDKEKIQHKIRIFFEVIGAIKPKSIKNHPGAVDQG